MAPAAARRSAPSISSVPKHDPAAPSTSVQDMSLEEEEATASASKPEESHVVTAGTIDEPTEPSHVEAAPIILPDESTAWLSRIHLLDLPIELLEAICREYLDICSCVCLGLACKTLFNLTEHIHPIQAGLHMRTSGKCLGHLLTSWMAPKYSFDHSRGKFLLKKHYLRNEELIERQWRQKEAWRKIRLAMDKSGAAVAYESRSRRRGF